MYTLGGTFDEYVRWDWNSGVFTSHFPTAQYKETIVPMVHAVTQTRPGYYIKYNQVEFTGDANTFVLVGTSYGKFANQPIEVYIDGTASRDRVAKFNVENAEDGTITPQSISTSKTISKGKHDVYLKFTAESGYDKTTTIYSIGFVKN